jgi:hypothetical protein
MPPTDDDLIFQWDSVIDDSTYYELLGVMEIAADGAIKDA